MTANPYFAGLDAATIASIANFDASSVPEPTTLALLGIGIAGLGAARRRKAA